MLPQRFDPALRLGRISDAIQPSLELYELAEPGDAVEMDADISPPPHLTLLLDPRSLAQHGRQCRSQLFRSIRRKPMKA